MTPIQYIFFIIFATVICTLVTEVLSNDPNFCSCNPRDYPYFVKLSIRRGNKTYKCGGTIIKPRWVITAGHCVSPKKGCPVSCVNVTAGHTPKYFQLVEAERFIRHPNYEPKARSPTCYDLALLHLKKRIKYTAAVCPIPIAGPEVYKKFLKCCPRTVKALGWGTQKIDPKTGMKVKPECAKDEIHCVYLNAKHQEECNDPVKWYPAECYHLCTDGDGSAVTHGDSGGPLVWDDTYQVGVISFGYGCGLKEGRGFHTRLDRFSEWIENITNCKYRN